MARLLVSVRTAAEARTADRAGADIIDVKEPARGVLGRADDAVIRSVVAVSGRRPVSVALGELMDTCDNRPTPLPPLDGVRFAKIGLTRCADRPDWSILWQDLRRRIEDATAGRTELIAATYADTARAGAPSIAEVFDLSVAVGCQVLLIDTWLKDGRALLEWIDTDTLAALSAQCRDAGMELAVAGSISADDFTALHRAAPAIVAVRGAACRHHQREARVEADRVRRLARLTRAIDPIDNRRPADLVES